MRKIWDEIEVFPLTEQRLADQAKQARKTSGLHRHKNRRNEREIGTKK